MPRVVQRYGDVCLCLKLIRHLQLSIPVALASACTLQTLVPESMCAIGDESKPAVHFPKFVIGTTCAKGFVDPFGLRWADAAARYHLLRRKKVWRHQSVSKHAPPAQQARPAPSRRKKFFVGRQIRPAGPPLATNPGGNQPELQAGRTMTARPFSAQQPTASAGV